MFCEDVLTHCDCQSSHLYSSPILTMLYLQFSPCSAGIWHLRLTNHSQALTRALMWVSHFYWSSIYCAFAVIKPMLCCFCWSLIMHLGVNSVPGLRCTTTVWIVLVVYKEVKKSFLSKFINTHTICKLKNYSYSLYIGNINNKIIIFIIK